MNMHWMKLAFAVVFGTATMAAATPDALARPTGCQANCAHGSCSTSNDAKDCGCCSDGTAYCGMATDCAAHPTSVVTVVVKDIVGTGGAVSATGLLDKVKATIDGSDTSAAFLDALSWYSNAVLNGEVDEIAAAQEYVDDTYAALPDGQALIALRVVMDGMVSPATK